MTEILSEKNVLVGFGGKFGRMEIRETRSIGKVTRSVFSLFPGFARPADHPSIGCYVGEDFYFVVDADGRMDEIATKMNLGSRI